MAAGCRRRLLLFILSGIFCQASAAGLEQQLNCPEGFFLSETGCLPCDCRGNAHSCQDGTGLCIDCRNHSAGDSCQLCEDGYMPEPGLERLVCTPCACPLPVASNSFAVRCDRDGAALRCRCRHGYAGATCERCAPGYYGNPLAMGGSCQKCDCNGNSDPNLISSECHSVTGRCLLCWGHTAGARCQRCAPGYYGDALSAKNCRECECDACGTSSCDDRTGVCHCKPGVTGRRCDRCEDGSSGFSGCQGCRRCECGPASTRSTCHPLTHSCPCRPGAGGRYCQRCLPGFWGYGPAGCQKCGCDSGHCDMQTGECLAEASTHSLCHAGCDECTWHLIGDLRLSNKTLDQLRVAVLNVSTGAAANDRLKFYNYTTQRLQVQFRSWRKTWSEVEAAAAEAEETAGGVTFDLLWLQTSEEVVRTLAEQLHNASVETLSQSEQLNSRMRKLNGRIEEMVGDWERYSEVQEVEPEVERSSRAAADRMLGWMQQVELLAAEPGATKEASGAQDLLRRGRLMEQRLQLTERRLPALRQRLALLRSGLLEAEGLLLTAAAALQDGQGRTGASVLQLHRKEVKQQRFSQDVSSVNVTLEESRSFVSEAGGAVEQLHVLLQNVSQVHAALDGAARSLLDRAQRLSLVDTHLVERADRHSQDLDRQAEQLDQDLKQSDANGFVQKAISAANVYNNIVKYLDDANITSLTTDSLSHRAEDAVAGVNMQLQHLVTQSDLVFKEAVSLHSQQTEVQSEVADKLQYIHETRETMDKNSKKLSEILQDIREVHEDRTPQRLNFSLEVVEETLNRSAQLLHTVVPISSRVEQWATNMHNKDYSATAYQEAVDSAGQAVEKLNVVVPELLDKLRVVEQKRPVNNVTTNILRIRELIAQARSVARKVQVSMKFGGQSSVEVHPHSSLEDLKTVTSISLFMRVDPDRDPIEDRFVLYLGDRSGRRDYMGLAIKNDNLVFVYNLGGEDVEISLSSKPVSQWPAVFNYIRMERLGRHGKVFLTLPSQTFTDEQKFIQKGEAPGTDSLFDLDPKDTVFLVGGVPPGVKLPPLLALAPFVGCIELASLNNHVISLYNFRETHTINVVESPPCPRYKLAFSQSRIASYLFDGTGYALINNIERRAKFGVVTRFDIAVRTVSSDGVLLLMVSGDNFFLLEVKNGFLRLMYDFGFSGGPKLLENNSPKLLINDARYHEVSVIYHQSKKVILLVDKSHVKSMENPKTTLPFSDIYIGGAPSTVLQSRLELSSLAGLKGCVKGFQFQKKDFNLLEEPGTIGISSGCPEESFMSHKAYFSGQSFLGSTARVSSWESFEGGLNFRTLLPSGLLLQLGHGSDELSVSLENGAVLLTVRGTKVRSRRSQYHDGHTHFVVASVSGQRFSLLVDDKDKQEKKQPASASRPPPQPAAHSLYLGGSPRSSFKNFTGCISYAYISRQDRDIEPEDFQRYSEKVQASLQDCPVQAPPAALQSRRKGTPPRARQQVTREAVSAPPGLVELRSDDPGRSESCYLSSSPTALSRAFRYGGIQTSRQHYTHLPESFSQRSHLSLSLKTLTSSGIILYVCDELEEDFMALFLVQGKLLYTFNVGKQTVQVRSREKYDDGVWHNIMCIRDGSLGRLLIDGVTVLEDRAESRNVSWRVSSPLFIGGVPPGKALKNIKDVSTDGFSGCLRNLQLDGRWLSSLAETFAVTPCFQGVSETGTYFSEGGGYALLDRRLHPGRRLQLAVQVRPRASRGLVLLLLPRRGPGFLSVHLHHGKVAALLAGGAGRAEAEAEVEVEPPHGVCSGGWFQITVVWDGNDLRITVGLKSGFAVAPGILSSSDAAGQVFVGGAPEPLLPPGAAVKTPYVGCLRNLNINSHRVDFSKAALVSGAVSVTTCPK